MSISYHGRGVEEGGKLTVFVLETPIYDETVYPPILLGISRSLVTGTDIPGTSPIKFSGSFSGDASELTIDGVSLSGSLQAGTQTRTGYATSKDFSGRPYSASVTFTAPTTSSLYVVNVISSENRAWTVQSQTTGGFVIQTNSSIAINNNVYWTVAALTQ